MTEEEAKTKWCPMVRAGNEAGCNRNGSEGAPITNCLASECMWWVSEKPIKYGVPRNGKTEEPCGHCGACNG